MAMPSLDFSKCRVLALLIMTCLISGAFAQTDGASPADGTAEAAPAGKSGSVPTPPDVDLLKRPVDAKTRRKQDKALAAELSNTYKHWLNEDVVWIITDQERNAFLHLSNDEERDQFIRQFWQRRNPTPDSPENPYKEEIYRRIAYANEHFSAGIPGWKTDRGRIYIMYGKPDQTDSHPSGGLYQQPLDEGGGTTSTYPFEVWVYHHLEGRDLGSEVKIEFVDTCSCGDYHLTMDPSEKNALLQVPGAALSPYQGLTADPSKRFDRLARYAALSRPPEIKFKDLQENITHRVSVNLLPFDVRADFVKITSDTVLVPITIQVKNRDITFANKDGVQRGTVNILGQVSTLTGRVTETFEDTIQIDEPAELLSRILNNHSMYWKALTLPPGRYRLDLVLKDVNGDRAGSWSKGIVVPDYSDDRLTSSSLILADQMKKLGARDVNSGSFVIGTTRVRPRVEPADGRPATFTRSQRMNLWMQVYNLGIDQQTHKPNATIEYDIVNAASKRPVVHTVESTREMGNVGEQITLEKSLPLTALEPGIYQLTIRVDDKVSKQTISPSARFAVTDESASAQPLPPAAGKP